MDPKEIRDKFCSLRLEDRKSLLLVSKQVSYEAMDVFYRDNVFEIRLKQTFDERVHLWPCMTDVDFQKIREMHLVLSSRFNGYDFITDPKLWCIFPRALKLLTIITQQPTCFVPRVGKDTFAGRMRSWIKWCWILWTYGGIRYMALALFYISSMYLVPL